VLPKVKVKPSGSSAVMSSSPLAMPPEQPPPQLAMLWPLVDTQA
jgi:hypothetical protein